MKKIVLLLALTLLHLGCARKAKNPPPAPTEITSDTVVEMQTSARNSLNYLGIYKGSLPCADCAGVETSLQLSEGFSYTLTQKYLGKNTKINEKKGTFSWNRAGTAIVLEDIDDSPNQYLVGENKLTQLDLNNAVVSGKLASRYILTKISETQAVQSEERAKAMATSLPGTKWKLAELNGKTITLKSERDLVLEFKSANEFTAFAGCNGISGKYENVAHKIRFMNVMSTRMACADMSVETGLIKALESADNVVHNPKVLQFRQGGTILAKFDAFTQTR